MERYETLGMVGEGSYGTVLKCRNRDTGKIVAIKKFLDSDDDKAVKKIALREIKMLKQLHHDNLVNLLEVWRRRRRWYLVFEFVERTVLDDLEQNPRGLDINTTRQHLYQILRATAFCHQHNIIHRDIKPENILVSQGGVVKLCDFGFARTMAAPGEVCVYTDYVATRWYRAPELLVGDTKYGKPVDVWALGCLLIEMITGEPLFPGDSDLDQLYHIIRCFGNLTARHQDLFYRNPVFSGVRLPEVFTRLPLEQRYPRLTVTVLSLAQSCLQMDPEKRQQCSDLLQHHFFTHDHFHTRFLDELNVMIQKEQRENSTLPKIPTTPRREREEGEERTGKLKDKSNSKLFKSTSNTSHPATTTKPPKNTDSKLGNNTAVTSKTKPGKNNISDLRKEALKDAETSKSFKSSTFERSDSITTVLSVTNTATAKPKAGKTNASNSNDAETSKSSNMSASDCSESTATLTNEIVNNEMTKSKPGKTNLLDSRREPVKEPENNSSTKTFKTSTSDDTNSNPKFSKTSTIDHCGLNSPPKTSKSLTFDYLDASSASKPVKQSTVTSSDVTKTLVTSLTAGNSATLSKPCKTSTSETSAISKPSKTFISEVKKEVKTTETILGKPCKNVETGSCSESKLPDDTILSAPARPFKTFSTDTHHAEVLASTSSTSEAAPKQSKMNNDDDRMDSTESCIAIRTKKTKAFNASSGTNEPGEPSEPVNAGHPDADPSSPAGAARENFTGSLPNPNRPLSPAVPPPPSSTPVTPPFSVVADGISLVANSSLGLGVGPHPGTHGLRFIDKARTHGGMYSRAAQQSLSSHCTGALTTQVFSEKSVARERSFPSDRSSHGSHGSITMTKRKSDLRFPELRNPVLPELRGSDGKHSKGSNKEQKKAKGPVSSLTNTHTLQHAHDSQDLPGCL